MAGVPDRVDRRRGTLRTWWLHRRNRGFWRVVARLALVSAIVDPWLIFLLAVRK